MHIGYKKGDIVLVDLEPIKGSEQGKTRRCVIIQNNIANLYSPVTNIIPLTDAKNVKKWYKCLVPLSKSEKGLTKDVAAQCNQIRTIDKSRIIKKIGSLNQSTMEKVDMAIDVSLGLV